MSNPPRLAGLGVQWEVCSTDLLCCLITNDAEIIFARAPDGTRHFQLRADKRLQPVTALVPRVVEARLYTCRLFGGASLGTAAEAHAFSGSYMA